MVLYFQIIDWGGGRLDIHDFCYNLNEPNGYHDCKDYLKAVMTLVVASSI